MKTTTKSIAYGMTTGIAVFAMFSEAIAEIGHRPETINGLAQVNCSVFFVMIMSFWKLLGLLTGAAASHLVCHDDLCHVVVMLGRQILTFALLAS